MYLIPPGTLRQPHHPIVILHQLGCHFRIRFYSQKEPELLWLRKQNGLLKVTQLIRGQKKKKKAIVSMSANFSIPQNSQPKNCLNSPKVRIGHDKTYFSLNFSICFISLNYKQSNTLNCILTLKKFPFMPLSFLLLTFLILYALSLDNAHF